MTFLNLLPYVRLLTMTFDSQTTRTDSGFSVSAIYSVLGCNLQDPWPSSNSMASDQLVYDYFLLLGQIEGTIEPY